MQTTMRELRVVCFLVVALLFLAAAPCVAEESLAEQVQQTIERFRNEEPRTAKLFEDSYGYVVFPRIEKGAAGVGAAYGEGLVYEKKEPVAMAELRHITVGVQAGGGTYAEVIFFESEAIMAPFREGDVIATRQAKAFGPHDSHAINMPDRPGLSVFTLKRTGGFAEATVGTRQLRFLALPQ